MSIWTDLAVWRGPTVNQTKGHVECRGLVVHIASGFYEGTISWERNPAADVSSHFVLSRTGLLAQLIDTDDTAWTQRAGNGHWLSVECEGFALDDALHASHPGWETLTGAQVEAIARLLVHGHQQYGYPLQLAHDPTGRGLGYHSMGAEHGYDWGHLHCPGEPIKAQLPAILARALVLAGLPPTSTGGTDVATNQDVEDLMNRTINGNRIASILGEEDAANDTVRAIATMLAEVDDKLDTVLTAIKAIPAPGGGTVVTGSALTITLTGTAEPAAPGA
jgi:hypothetical protein